MDDQPQRMPIRVPDLGLEETSLSLSVWLVATGASLAAGDRVVELLGGPAAIDLPAPCSGVLREKLVREDQRVRTGQILGWIDSASSRRR